MPQAFLNPLSSVELPLSTVYLRFDVSDSFSESDFQTRLRKMAKPAMPNGLTGHLEYLEIQSEHQNVVMASNYDIPRDDVPTFQEWCHRTFPEAIFDLTA